MTFEVGDIVKNISQQYLNNNVNTPMPIGSYHLVVEVDKRTHALALNNNPVLVYWPPAFKKIKHLSEITKFERALYDI